MKYIKNINEYNTEDILFWEIVDFDFDSIPFSDNEYHLIKNMLDINIEISATFYEILVTAIQQSGDDFSISKANDEYYYIEDFISLKYYKCDTIEGVIQCINFLLNYYYTL